MGIIITMFFYDDMPKTFLPQIVMILVINLRYQRRIFTDMTFLPFYHLEFTRLTDFE